LEDVGAVEFHRARRDAQMVGNGLVVVAAEQLVEHLALALAQAGQRSAQALGLRPDWLALRAGGRQGLLHAVDQQVVLEGLFQKIPGAVLDCGNGHAHIAMPGEKQHRPGTAQLREFLEGVQTGERLHADVHQHHGVAPVVLAYGGGLEEGRAAVPGGRAVAARVEQPGQAVAHVGVVVNDVDGNRFMEPLLRWGRWRRRSSGSQTVKRAPPSSGSCCTSMRPWCASTMERQMARPMPMPPSLVLKKALKICSRSSSRTPGPLSATHNCAIGGSAAASTQTRTCPGRLAPCGGPAQGVGHQVGDHMLQQQAVGLHPYGAPRAARSAGRRRQGAYGWRCSAHEACEVETLVRQFALPRKGIDALDDAASLVRQAGHALHHGGSLRPAQCCGCAGG
jgi:hypothetical protein